MPPDLRAYALQAQLGAHRRKAEQACSTIREAATHGRLVVSMSWGKDSCALGALAIEALAPARVQMFHLASPYELPGGERVRAWFGERADVVEVPSGRTLEETIEWLRDVGGLFYERDAQHGAGKKRKAGAGVEWAAERYAVQAMGLRADESKGRRAGFRARGTTYQLQRGLWVTCPLAWWSALDVWAYLVSRGVPWHPLYDAETHGMRREELRNAGWLTVRDEARVAWLRVHYPEQYQALEQAFPQVRRLT